MNIVATKKRRHTVLDKLRKPHLVMSDDEIQYIKNSLNRMEYGKQDNAEFAEEANDLIANHNNGVRLDEELTKKGLEYLTRPAIYKNLGTREQDIIDNFKEFKLESFYDDYNGYRHYYSPEWRVIGNNGNSFNYIGKG